LNVSYTWVCKLCGATNNPLAQVCTSCKLPAIASSEEVDLARSSGSVEIVYQRRGNAKKARETWRLQSTWRKVLDVIAISAAFGGIGLAKFAGPITHNIFGIVITVFGLAVLLTVRRKRTQQPSHEYYAETQN
jgi:hypothetical protein